MLAVYRMKIRATLKIQVDFLVFFIDEISFFVVIVKGDSYSDACVVCCCPCCAALQMRNELKVRGLA